MKNQRTCIACRTTKDKSELIRIVKNKDGEIKVCTSPKDQGRGAYICANKECLEKAIKSKALNRAFSCEISAELYEEIKQNLK